MHNIWDAGASNWKIYIRHTQMEDLRCIKFAVLSIFSINLMKHSLVAVRTNRPGHRRRCRQGENLTTNG